MKLPPTNLRRGPTASRDDAAFLESARTLARNLIELCGLTSTSKVLDIGCGSARLLYGIVEEIGVVKEYLGTDVDARRIDWLRDNVRLPFASFHWIDFQNERYHSAGHRAMPDIPGSTFDVIVLNSVFSHMRMADILLHLDLIVTKLSPSGRCYLTAFVEDGVPLEEENPIDYIREWKGPLHCVRLNRTAFEAALSAAGLIVESANYSAPMKRQSQYIVSSRFKGGEPRVGQGRDRMEKDPQTG